MFQLIAINFSQKSTHFSLLSPTSPCELCEREVTSPSNLKVVGALIGPDFINYYASSLDILKIYFLSSVYSKSYLI